MSWTLPRDWTAGERVTEALLNQQIRDNFRSGPTATSASSPATQLAALVGTPANGARASYLNNPNSVGLTYDSTAGKWISEAFLLLTGQSSTSNSTTYVTLNTAIYPSGFKPVTGGTPKPEFRVYGFVQAASASTMTIAVSIFQFDGAGALPAAGNEFAATTSASDTAQHFLDSGWVGGGTYNGSGSNYYAAALRIKSANTTGAKTWTALNLETRLSF